MVEIIRDGLSGPLSWYHGLGGALAVALVAVAAGRRSPFKFAGSPSPYSLSSPHWPWFVMSALWIVGVFYAESLDGLLSEELGEVLTTALVPPIVPPLVIAGVTRVLAEISRP